MAILKEELFQRALRNREIKNNPAYLDEYEYNKKCIKIITEMAGEHLVSIWREEFSLKFPHQTDHK